MPRLRGEGDRTDPRGEGCFASYTCVEKVVEALTAMMFLGVLALVI